MNDLKYEKYINMKTRIFFSLIFLCLTVISFGQISSLGPFSLTAPENSSNFQWYHDNTALAGPAGMDSLYSTTSAGVYWVEYDMDTCTMENDAFYIIIAESGTDSTNLVAPSGKSNYQWYKDETALSGETNATLNILHITTSPGVYYVTYDEASCTIQSRNLNVNLLLADFDSDGIPDIDDIDDDNDGILDAEEGTTDIDNDNIPNYLDLDSDGDGCSDALEAGATIDLTTDFQFPTNSVGNNGLDDSLEGANDDGIINYTSTYITNALDSTISAICFVCAAGDTAPTLSATTSSNTCHITTVDLDALHTGTIPTGIDLVWSTDNDASDGLSSTESSPTGTSGTYYAYYYEVAQDCYSPASSGIVVTINPCDPNTNYAPIFTSTNTVSFQENTDSTTVVINVESDDDSDSEGSGLTYSITSSGNSPDAAFFSIDASTGELTFNNIPDFENPMDVDGNNQYVIEVEVCDSGGLCTLQIITISVSNDESDDPPCAAGGMPPVFVDTTQMNPFTFNTPSGVTNIQWYQNGNMVVGDTLETYETYQPGTYWATYTLNDSGDCNSESDTIYIVLLEGAPDSVTLEGPAGQIGYQWYKNGTAIDSVGVKDHTLANAISAVGVYHLTYDGPNCLVETRPFAVSLFAMPDPVEIAICGSEMVNLDTLLPSPLAPDVSLVWSSDDDFSDGLDDIVTMPINTEATYYAYFQNDTTECYSPSSQPVIVTIDNTLPNCDFDGDGVANMDDLDDDNDGVLDSEEGTLTTDTDMDGFANQFDLDSDEWRWLL